MDNYNGKTYARQDTDMSVGSWIGTLILSAIPIVGFICLIVWAVSSSPEKRSRKNWAIAQFILTLIGYYKSGVCHHGRRVSGVSAELRQIPQPGFSRVGGHLFFQH